MRFLRKLADSGQAILVTIHQPSASLFAQFDTLLLLGRFPFIHHSGLRNTNFIPIQLKGVKRSTLEISETRPQQSKTTSLAKVPLALGELIQLNS